MRKSRLPHCLIVIVIAVALKHAPVRGAEWKLDKNYRLDITPYAWLLDLNGTVGAKGHELHVNAPFAESSKHLNFAAMLAVDLTFRDKFGITSNLNLAMLGDSEDIKNVSLHSSSSMLTSDIAGFYRVASRPIIPDSPKILDLDVFAGIRLWRTGLKLNVKRTTGNQKLSQNKVWVDPIIGARAVMHLNDKWKFRLRGGVGGFSAASKLTWEASAIVMYKFKENIHFVAGYRGIGVNYNKGNGNSKFAFDVTLKGPIIGTIFSF